MLAPMTEPDFDLEGDLAHEEATGRIVFPAGCVTDAQRIANLEYRLRYLNELSHAANEQGMPVGAGHLKAFLRTQDALAAARSAQRNQN